MLIACDYNICSTGYYKPNKCITMKKNKFKVWKKISIGGHIRNEYLQKELLLPNVYRSIAGLPSNLIDEVKVPVQKREINLVLLTIKQLGFIYEPSYSDIVKRAKEFKLSECPDCTIFYLCLNDIDQKVNERIHVSIEKEYLKEKKHYFGLPCLLKYEPNKKYKKDNEKGRCLGWGIPDGDKWPLDSKIVFELN